MDPYVANCLQNLREIGNTTDWKNKYLSVGEDGLVHVVNTAGIYNGLCRCIKSIKSSDFKSKEDRDLYRVGDRIYRMVVFIFRTTDHGVYLDLCLKAVDEYNKLAKENSCAPIHHLYGRDEVIPEIDGSKSESEAMASEKPSEVSKYVQDYIDKNYPKQAVENAQNEETRSKSIHGDVELAITSEKRQAKRKLNNIPRELLHLETSKGFKIAVPNFNKENSNMLVTRSKLKGG